MRHTDDAKGEVTRCRCPYCEQEICAEIPLFCQPCGVTLRYCVRCQRVVEREATVCPECGGELTSDKGGRT